MDKNLVFDLKWHKLLCQSFLFQHIPFVDFVLVAGSMALENVHENSDFDVIVAAKFGRLYTARFFCLFFYKILGWRKKIDGGFCFNHFVTEKSYCLQPPYNLYWQRLYQNLVPIFGNVDKIKTFFKENTWTQGLSEERSDEESQRFFANAQNDREWDLRFEHKASSLIKLFLEKIFSGKVGDWLEQRAKSYQIKKIKKFLKKHPPGYKPRLIYNNEEVELHLDTRRTEKVF